MSEEEEENLIAACISLAMPTKSSKTTKKSSADTHPKGAVIQARGTQLQSQGKFSIQNQNHPMGMTLPFNLPLKTRPSTFPLLDL
jgi:hypothetical protein